jgi:hypothetical protein
LRQLLKDFVQVRIIDISNVDIANLQFDFDLVFAIMFMNGHGEIYSRYGGRTPWNSESRVSLEGLKYTMREVLIRHDPTQRPVAPPAPPVLARELPSGRRSCMHCHEVWEGLRRQSRQRGTFDPQSLFVYPRPENIGLTLEVDAGNVVNRVSDKSVAARVGIVPGSRIIQIGNSQIHSQADVSWALHNAPKSGRLSIRFTRESETKFATIPLVKGWKEQNLSWRASMRNEESPQRVAK